MTNETVTLVAKRIAELERMRNSIDSIVGLVRIFVAGHYASFEWAEDRLRLEVPDGLWVFQYEVVGRVDHVSRVEVRFFSLTTSTAEYHLQRQKGSGEMKLENVDVVWDGLDKLLWLLIARYELQKAWPHLT